MGSPPDINPAGRQVMLAASSFAGNPEPRSVIDDRGAFAASWPTCRRLSLLTGLALLHLIPFATPGQSHARSLRHRLR